jgi:hypothetical protein
MNMIVQGQISLKGAAAAKTNVRLAHKLQITTRQVLEI